MKSVKRPIDTGFWEDDKVIDCFTPEDKLFFLYLLTNPHTSQVGIYHLPYKIAAFELGFSVEALKSLIDRFQSKYKVIAYSPAHQEVAVLNALKHNIVKGGKPVIDCVKSELSHVKDEILIEKVNDHLQEFWEASDRQTDKIIQKIFFEKVGRRKEPKEDLNENENENENERIVDDSWTFRQNADKSAFDHFSPKKTLKADPNTSIRKSIIDYLNQKLGTKYKPNASKNKTVINARLNEGYTLDDFKQVIDNKYNDWANDAKMVKYLRPETLFGTKFDGYLNEQSANPYQPQKRIYD